jgi:hypothetical protein
MLYRPIDAAQLHCEMRLGQAAVRAGALQGGAGIGLFAKGVDGNARHWAFMRRGAKRFDLRGLAHVVFRSRVT